MEKVDASGMGAFGAQHALAQEYGALVRRYLQHGSDQAKGGVPENSWAQARERARRRARIEPRARAWQWGPPAGPAPGAGR